MPARSMASAASAALLVRAVAVHAGTACLTGVVAARKLEEAFGKAEHASLRAPRQSRRELGLRRMGHGERTGGSASKWL